MVTVNISSYLLHSFKIFFNSVMIHIITATIISIASPPKVKMESYNIKQM